jgi:hydroxymethylbilane synthase
MSTTRIGTRGSTLALWQANHVKKLLEASGSVQAEIITIKTSGDQDQESSISQIGTKGVFIKELEEALLDQRIDLAVHSMKDVPTQIPEGLTIAAILKRDEVRDCLVSKFGHKLAKLPRSARVGTSSVRRRAQLLRNRPDLDVRELRGNIDTRLRKLDECEYHAIVLAKAGLDRLGLGWRAAEVLTTEIMLPAVGQGALGIETRADDEEAKNLVVALADPNTRACVSAERALLAELEGGCQVPLGAWANIEAGFLSLDACVVSPDGADYIRLSRFGGMQAAETIGKKLGEEFRAAGADRILQLARSTEQSNSEQQEAAPGDSARHDIARGTAE